MGEFASKGVGVGGLTTGIIGTSLAGLMALNNGNGGILGGLLGNNQQNEKMTALMNENTLLKANAYVDTQIKDSNSQICQLKTESAVQEQQIHCLEKQMGLREQIVDGKIAQVALTANNGIDRVGCALNCLQRTVDGISSTYVPAGKVTPLPAPYPFPPVPPYLPPFVPPIVPPVTGGTTTGGTTTETPTTTNNG
jgi:hypothetical protein